MLEKYALQTTDKVFIQQSENNKGVGTLNDDGHLYFFDEENHVGIGDDVVGTLPDGGDVRTDINIGVVVALPGVHPLACERVVGI